MKASVLLIIFCILNLSILKVKAQEVVLSFEPPRIKPGSLVMVRANFTSQKYMTCTMDLPVDAHFQLISTEPGLTRLVNGVYTQEHRWILQAVSSGVVTWKDLKAKVQYIEKEVELKLPPLKLQIKPYDSFDESDEPETLHTGEAREEKITKSSQLFLYLLLVPLVGLFILFFVKRGTSIWS
ncbi:MAG: hypothetical protein AAF984_06945 [Verrucomicrobiota bacterium]